MDMGSAILGPRRLLQNAHREAQELEDRPHPAGVSAEAALGLLQRWKKELGG